MSKKKNVWNGDDEFSFNFSDDLKTLDKIMIETSKKKSIKKKKRWVKIADGVYQNLAKIRAEENKKPKKKKKKRIKIGDGAYQNLRYSYKPEKKKKKVYTRNPLFKGLGNKE